jgi:hypothetical protein
MELEPQGAGGCHLIQERGRGHLLSQVGARTQAQ